MTNVEELIPHRPPFLFVDEIISQSENSLIARRKVRPEEDFFQGHYPGNPIMPGVLISEAVFQTGALFLVKHLEGSGELTGKEVPVLARISDARFRSIVRPGDELTIEVHLKEKVLGFYFLKGFVKNAGKRVMDVEFGVSMAEAPQERKA